MIGLLTDDEKEFVTKDLLIELEEDILVKLEFDLQLPGPYQSLERFIRLLGYQKVPEILSMATELCKLSLVEASFLNLSPSELASAAVILAINIHNREVGKKSFFEYSKKGVCMNKKLWDHDMVKNTKIDLETFNHSLEMMTEFMV